MDLINIRDHSSIGVAFLVLAAVAIWIGLPNRDGFNVGPLRNLYVLHLYPIFVMVLIVAGLALVVGLP